MGLVGARCGGRSRFRSVLLGHLSLVSVWVSVWLRLPLCPVWLPVLFCAGGARVGRPAVHRAGGPCAATAAAAVLVLLPESAGLLPVRWRVSRRLATRTGPAGPASIKQADPTNAQTVDLAGGPD